MTPGLTKGVAPSVIAADFGAFAEQLALVEPHGVRWHVDVMDGHYVPNLTIGPWAVELVAARTSLPQDVHLMITNPVDTWEWYAKAGAGRIAFHPETAPDAAALLRTIASAGIGPGLAVNPDVEVAAIKSHLHDVDHLIVMSVYPGFSGQRFIPDVLEKVRELRRIVDGEGLDIDLVIDGGVNLETADACLDAGADILVSASAIFGAPDPAAAASALREKVERAS